MPLLHPPPPGLSTGQCEYSSGKDQTSAGVAAVYDDGEHVVGTKYDTTVRKILHDHDPHTHLYALLCD